MNNAKAPPAARIGAANALLDRGYGKPGQAVDTQEIVHPQRDYSSLSNEQLLTLIDILAPVEGGIPPEFAEAVEALRRETQRCEGNGSAAA